MQFFICRFSGLDHTGSIPDERQDRVWLHHLLVRPTPTPLLSLFLMPLLLFTLISSSLMNRPWFLILFRLFCETAAGYYQLFLRLYVFISQIYR